MKSFAIATLAATVMFVSASVFANGPGMNPPPPAANKGDVEIDVNKGEIVQHQLDGSTQNNQEAAIGFVGNDVASNVEINVDNGLIHQFQFGGAANDQYAAIGAVVASIDADVSVKAGDIYQVQSASTHNSKQTARIGVVGCDRCP